MNYRTKIRLIFIGLMILIFSLLNLWVCIEKESKTIENSINKLKVIINPIYQSIRERHDEFDYNDLIKEMLSFDNEILITIVDLSGNVIVSTKEDVHNGDALFLDEMLYMDQSYSVCEEYYYKLSMPIYNQEKVNGFVIFDVNKSIVNTPKSIRYLGFKKNIEFAVVIVCIFICIFLGWLVFYENKNDLNDLEKGLQAIPKGIFAPIEVNKNKNYKNIYIQYNILVEELAYITKQQAINESRRKSFLTMISHELKTPITTISAYIEGLISGVAKDSAKREKYQQIIYQKMQQLTKQIEDLFKYAQEESDRFKYNFEECYGDELFGAIFENLSSQNKKNLEVKNMIPKCIINADKTRIEQVVMNLYNNAIKHSKEADILKLCAYRQDQEIIIEVSDNGEGIDPKDMPYIFDYFYQGKTSKEKDYEGVGLGLAICRDIVDKHHGFIRVKSELGKGTRFTIHIPIV